MIKNKNRSQFRLFQSACIAGIILAISCIILLTPALAQVSQKLELAPVILDGRQIFQVSSSGQFTAKERANLISFQLREAVSSPEPLIDLDASDEESGKTQISTDNSEE